MPFGRALAPQMLHRHASRAEAVARISWCISERALGVVTGEVGAARPSRSAPPWPGWAPPGTPPSTSVTPPSVAAACTPGSSPPSVGSPLPKVALILQTAELLAAEEHERGRTVVPVLDEDEGHLLGIEQLEELRLLTLCRACCYAEQAAAGAGSSCRARETQPAARHNYSCWR